MKRITTTLFCIALLAGLVGCNANIRMSERVVLDDNSTLQIADLETRPSLLHPHQKGMILVEGQIDQDGNLVGPLQKQVLRTDASGSIVQQVASPTGYALGQALRRPDSTNISNQSSASSDAYGAGGTGHGGNANNAGSKFSPVYNPHVTAHGGNVGNVSANAEAQQQMQQQQMQQQAY